MNYKGKFIVFYGINNTGKTTQAKKLSDYLNKNGQKTEYIKYPIYNTRPSGEIINDYLRNDNPHRLSAREIQIIYTLNRTQFETKLIEKLQNGINIVAEDYTGTGIAWGVGAGVDRNFLEEINSHLLKEDLAFLFNGERFIEAIEKKHKHETNETLTNKVRAIHLDLAKKNNWIIINSNQDKDTIHQEIINNIK